jgi:hypothetical protein
MALANGLLIDAMQGGFAAISHEHFPHRHLAMTSAVLALIDASVQYDETVEFPGIWHDILWMSRVSPVRLLPGGHTFKVGIRSVTGGVECSHDGRG